MTLCNERVLRNMPRYGYEVTRLTMDDINEMLEFRLYLEHGIVSRVIKSLTEPQIAALEPLNELCLRDDLPPRKHWEMQYGFPQGPASSGS